MKNSNLFQLGLFALIATIFSSCYGTKKAMPETDTSKHQAVVQKEEPNYTPISAENAKDLYAIISDPKSGGTIKIQLYTDSFNVSRDLPNQITTKNGKIFKTTGLTDGFAARAYHPCLVKSIDLGRKEIIVAFTDLVTGKVLQLMFKDQGSGYVLYSAEKEDAIRSGDIVFPRSFGKNSAKLYIDLTETQGESELKIFKEDRVGP